MRTRIATIVLSIVVMGLATAPALAVPTTPPPKPPNPLVVAQKAVADALTNLAKAKGAILAIRKKVAVTYEAKPEYKAAKNDFDKAKTDFDQAAQDTAAKLEADPAYKALIVKRDKAQAIIDGASGKSGPTSDDVAKLTDADIDAAGQERTDTAVALRKMQRDSQENSAAYTAARQRYNETKSVFDSLNAQIDDAVKLDVGYPPAQASVVQAESALDQAKQNVLNIEKAQATAVHPVTPPRKKY